MALPIQNNTITRLATVLLADAEGPDSFVEVMDTTRLSPQGGVVAVGTGLVGTPSEVIGYSSISGRFLMGLSRGLQGTQAGLHAAQELVGLVVTAGHVSELQVQFGPTSQRLAMSLGRSDTGFRWFDTEINELFIWFIHSWVIAAKIYPSSISLSAPFQEWRCPRSWVLAREYSQGDRWIEDAGNFSLWLCTANTRTNTIADWTEIGVGATGPQGASGPRGPQGITGPGILGPTGPLGLQGPVGDTGTPGTQGPQGLQGPPGPQGFPGVTGVDGYTGWQGPVGVPGARGVQGPTGISPAGPTGVIGPRGVDGTKSLNGVGNLSGRPSAGSVPTGYTYLAVDVAVVYTRTALSTWSSQAWAPQGPQGPQGIPGTTPGAAGATGPRGFTGPRGTTGIPGDTGSQGPQGPQQQGVQGPQGEQGPTGIAVTGPQGVTGPVGPQGATGPEGLPGVRGIKGDPGIAGKPGLPGLDGPKGPRGIPGVMGPQGDKGPVGVAGGIGPKGDAGPLGPLGPTGVQGPDGERGETGDKGIPGATGPRGPAGPVGPAGGNVNGPMGPTGPQGPDGDQGPQGLPGGYGNRGPRGPKGDPGNVYPGAQGLKGMDGPPGGPGDNSRPGAAGPRGPTGAACAPPSDTCADCETHTHSAADITPTNLTVDGIIETECTKAEEVVASSICVGGYEYNPEEVELWSNGVSSIARLFVRGAPCAGGTPDPLECECEFDYCSQRVYVYQSDTWYLSDEDDATWEKVEEDSKMFIGYFYGFYNEGEGRYYSGRWGTHGVAQYGHIDVECCGPELYRCPGDSSPDHGCADLLEQGQVVNCIKSVQQVNYNDTRQDCNCQGYISRLTLVKNYVPIHEVIKCNINPGHPVFSCPPLEVPEPPEYMLETIRQVRNDVGFTFTALDNTYMGPNNGSGNRREYLQNYGPARVQISLRGCNYKSRMRSVNWTLSFFGLQNPYLCNEASGTTEVGDEPVILSFPLFDYASSMSSQGEFGLDGAWGRSQGFIIDAPKLQWSTYDTYVDVFSVIPNPSVVAFIALKIINGVDGSGHYLATNHFCDSEAGSYPALCGAWQWLIADGGTPSLGNYIRNLTQGGVQVCHQVQAKCHISSAWMTTIASCFRPEDRGPPISATALISATYGEQYNVYAMASIIGTAPAIISAGQTVDIGTFTIPDIMQWRKYGPPWDQWGRDFEDGVGYWHDGCISGS